MRRLFLIENQNKNHIQLYLFISPRGTDLPATDRQMLCRITAGVAAAHAALIAAMVSFGMHHVPSLSPETVTIELKAGGTPAAIPAGKASSAGAEAPRTERKEKREDARSAKPAPEKARQAAARPVTKPAPPKAAPEESKTEEKLPPSTGAGPSESTASAGAPAAAPASGEGGQAGGAHAAGEGKSPAGSGGASGAGDSAGGAAAGPSSTREKALVLRRVSPEYPLRARRNGIEGTVTLAVEVRADGHAGEISVRKTSGSGMLDDAAVRAVRQWEFAPYREGGRAIARTYGIDVTFALTR